MASFGACASLKDAEDVPDAGTDSAISSSDGSPEVPDGQTPEGDAKVPGRDASSTDANVSDARYQFDGGITPRPTCVGGSSESYVPDVGCKPGTGPGGCTFSKVVRACKNGDCKDGLCQDLDWDVEAPAGTKPAFVYQVWGAAPDAVWAVGDGVYFWNGTTWTSVDIGETFDNFTQAFAVAGTTREDVTILVGNFQTGPMYLKRRNGSGMWTSVGQINATVWGGGLFALGNDRFLVHLGSSGLYFSAPGSIPFLGSLYGFAGGQHYTNALSGFKADDVMVASNGGQGSMFFNGTQLKPFGGDGSHAVVYTPDLIAFLDTGQYLDLYEAVSPFNRIGARVDLAVESASTSGTWQGLDGTGAGRLFACGSAGIVMHRKGTTWVKETIPSPASMNSVWASPWGDVYTAGSKVWHGR